MQRVFLIHGWGGSPQKDWMPWAKEELIKRGFEVYVPEMPDTEHPKIKSWINKLQETVSEIKPDDIFIGHSIGCLTILRYLETLGEGEEAAKVILIAPWQYLTLDENEEEADAKPWVETPIDYEKIKSKAGKFIAVFSDDDPWVSLRENKEYFEEKLSPEVVVMSNKGHFNQDKFPELLNYL